jgi:hypothetical protein
MKFLNILKLLDPQASNSFIMQIHQNDVQDQNLKENNFYVRIFYNLEEISDLPIKLKISYQKDRGISLDDLVNLLNDNSDSKIKYKNHC